MSIAYRIDVATASGVKVAEITDFSRLAYAKRVNEPGILEFQLEGNHRDLSKFERNGQITVYRSFDSGATWNADFYALHQYERRFTDKNGIDVFISQSPGIMSMLGWRYNLWYANTTNRTKFSSAKAETIMKTLVSYNLGANATTGNGRLRTGTLSDHTINIETDGTTGNTISWNNAYDNILETLQKLSLVAGGDFDLIKTAANTFEFRWYLGQRGTDRTATVVFSLENGNMLEPEYIKDYIGTKTVALVAGKGEDSSRDTAIRTSTPYYNATNFNVETFVDARNAAKGDTAALNTAGDEELQKNVPTETLNFKVNQTDSYKYGQHYFLGDKVTGKYKGITVTKKITGVDIKYERQGAFEQIDVTLEPIPY